MMGDYESAHETMKGMLWHAPQNLPLLITDTAYDGTPVTKFYAVCFGKERYQEGYVWALDYDQALVFARYRWSEGDIAVQPVC